MTISRSLTFILFIFTCSQSFCAVTSQTQIIPPLSFYEALPAKMNVQLAIGDLITASKSYKESHLLDRITIGRMFTVAQIAAEQQDPEAYPFF